MFSFIKLALAKLISGQLMDNLYTGISLPLLDTMVPGLSLPRYVRGSLFSGLDTSSPFDHQLIYRFHSRFPLVLLILSS